MIVIVLLFLFGLVYGQNSVRSVYENYENSTHPNVNLEEDLYSSDLTFLRNLSYLWRGDGRVIQGNYAERAWMFENTMALLGFLEGIKRASDVSPDKYSTVLRKSFDKFQEGRLRNWNDANNGVVSQQRLKAYYQAVFLGVLSGIGPGFIAAPDKDIAARYGEVSVPVLGYRATTQAIRSALLMEYAYRIAYAKAELASLYWHAKKQCDVVHNNTLGWQENIGNIGVAGVADVMSIGAGKACCGPNLAYLANIRSILDIGFRTLISQNIESLTLQCISLLAQLHNAKINLETMELVLYNLSVNYSQLALSEKAMVR